MKLPFCVACGERENLHHHHLIAASEGGSNEESNLITLCIRCHGLLHELTITVSHAKLVSDGIRKAKLAGTRLGPKAPAYEAYSGTAETRTPVEEVQIALFTREGVNLGDICRLTWRDVLMPNVNTGFKTITLSDETKAAVDKAVISLGLTKDQLGRNITETLRSPVGVNALALRVKMNRLKNPGTKRTKKPGNKKPLALYEIPLINGRIAFVPRVLIKKYGMATARAIRIAELGRQAAVTA